MYCNRKRFDQISCPSNEIQTFPFHCLVRGQYGIVVDGDKQVIHTVSDWTAWLYCAIYTCAINDGLNYIMVIVCYLGSVRTPTCYR